jgi:hypothetical protein
MLLSSIGDEFVSRADVRLISVACVQGGDGIYISGTGGHVVLPNGTRVYVCQRNESRDITIRNVHCHNNYRCAQNLNRHAPSVSTAHTLLTHLLFVLITSARACL